MSPHEYAAGAERSGDALRVLNIIILVKIRKERIRESFSIHSLEVTRN
jgi:hypothetical protein